MTTFRFTPWALASALAMVGLQANAALTLVSPSVETGTGLGHVNTVLTIQGHGKSALETGSVGVDSVTNTMAITGDAKTGASQTQLWTLGELGVDSASDLRLVFNANEPGSGRDITLTDLVLTIYDTSGAAVFSSSPFSPIHFDDTHPGTGKSGFVFGLDSADVSAAASVFAGSFDSFRVGLSASASGFAGGPETFYLATASSPVSPVPEPSTFALFAAGFAAMGAVVRRRSANR
jgi:hypothetical protein